MLDLIYSRTPQRLGPNFQKEKKISSSSPPVFNFDALELLSQIIKQKRNIKEKLIQFILIYFDADKNN